MTYICIYTYMYIQMCVYIYIYNIILYVDIILSSMPEVSAVVDAALSV